MQRNSKNKIIESCFVFKLCHARLMKILGVLTHYLTLESKLVIYTHTHTDTYILKAILSISN